MKNTFLTPAAPSLINQTAFPHKRLAPPDVQGRDASPDLWNTAPSSTVKKQKEPNRKDRPYRTGKSLFCGCFCCCFCLCSVSDEDKGVKKRDRLEKLRKASTTEQKWLLNTTFTETKGLLGTKKKHTIMCRASYLYNYIEISHNSLFFLSLLSTTV